jgi:hypothetical protein
VEVTAEDLVEGEKEEGSEEGSVVEKDGEKEEEEEVMEAKGVEAMEAKGVVMEAKGVEVMEVKGVEVMETVEVMEVMEVEVMEVKGGAAKLLLVNGDMLAILREGVSCSTKVPHSNCRDSCNSCDVQCHACPIARVGEAIAGPSADTLIHARYASDTRRNPFGDNHVSSRRIP